MKGTAPWQSTGWSSGGKHKAEVSVANSNGSVQCMGARENEELERQEGQCWVRQYDVRSF
jgi:hypothetical protein